MICPKLSTHAHRPRWRHYSIDFCKGGTCVKAVPPTWQPKILVTNIPPEKQSRSVLRRCARLGEFWRAAYFLVQLLYSKSQDVHKICTADVHSRHHFDQKVQSRGRAAPRKNCEKMCDSYSNLCAKCKFGRKSTMRHLSLNRWNVRCK